MRKTYVAPIAAGVLLAVAGTAQAATRTTTLGVSAVVNSNCIVSSQNLAFGGYDGTAAKTGTADITVRCSTRRRTGCR